MKIKIIFSVFVLLLVNTVNLFAQSDFNPCFGDDIDNPCPLDTWVIALVIAASLIAAVKLHRSKNSVL